MIDIVTSWLVYLQQSALPCMEYGNGAHSHGWCPAQAIVQPKYPRGAKRQGQHKQSYGHDEHAPSLMTGNQVI
jgi:hypothetical protein